jgi:aminomethyltransferase
MTEPLIRSGLHRSPLYNRHVALGAKMANFSGWEMPIEYPEGGVIREHTAVREAVGIFDVSHLGKAVVRGSGARDFVNTALTNDLGRIEPGRAQYSICCDPSGGAVDDLIAYLRSDDEVFLVPNAANAGEVVHRLAEAAPAGIEVENLHEAYGIVAVQGPHSDELLGAVGLPSGHQYMSFAEAEWQGHPMTVCRTGYTGERGYELVPLWPDAGSLWDALTEAGREFGALPCGLGARDTLRLEMGYPLHGQDLSMAISPVQARLTWAIGWKKPVFWGREALVAQREQGAARLLWGLEALDRGIPRRGMRVMGSDGTAIGEVTSGTYSPTKRVGIGLALLDQAVEEAAEVQVDVRGRMSRCRVVHPPFVESSTK